LDINTLKYITLFESLTGAKVKDCIVDDKITFIIEKGNMGLAIGKHGKNLKRVENAIKKTIRAIEFDEDVRQFIKNYAYPLRELEIVENDNIIQIKGKDTKTKALLIGRDKANLKKMINIVNRYFSIQDITVV
jgi:N utilization substance protein A